MVAPISSSTISNWSDSLFSKLDTKKQGYVDQADLAAALGTDSTDAASNDDDAAAMLKAIDGDGDGKITKSELSTAISKVADELNAQFDSGRVDKSQATSATSATGISITIEDSTGDDDDDDDTSIKATGGATAGAAASTAKAAPSGGGVAVSSSTTENTYSSAADTDSNGKVSDDEAAAYKKLMAKEAEGKPAHKPGEKPDHKPGGPDGDKDLARALDLLKQYVDNSGAAGSTASTSSAQTVDTSA